MPLKYLSRLREARGHALKQREQLSGSIEGAREALSPANLRRVASAEAERRVTVAALGVAVTARSHPIKAALAAGAAMLFIARKPIGEFMRGFHAADPQPNDLLPDGATDEAPSAHAADNAGDAPDDDAERNN